MIQIFEEEERVACRKLRRRFMTIYFVLLAVTLIACVIFLVAFLQGAMGKGLSATLNIALSSVFGAYSLFFFSVKMRMVNAYHRLYRNIDSGQKEQARGIFSRIEPSLITRNGVEFYSMVLMECVGKSGLKDSERHALIEKTKPQPIVPEGATVDIVTHGGVLICYEVK